MSNDDDPICPICLRPIPPEARQSLHHLVPKLKGGRHGPTVLLHQICHNEIHAALTEAELARVYNTPEKLRAYPQIARFAEWVGKKEPTFHNRTVGGRRKRPKRG
ncbi:MAG: HNH endonuclease [Pseudomonadota bacterium]